MTQPRQQELNTVIYPLYAARLYLDEVPGTTGHVEVSIINGVKISLVAHTYKGDVYSATAATIYGIDFAITLQDLEEAFTHTEPTSVEVSTSNSYGRVHKEATISFTRSELGIWSINVRATDKPAVKVEFKGIRSASHSIKGVPSVASTVSVRHFKAWLNIIERSMAVAMAIHGHSNEKVLLPREQPAAS